MKQHCCLYPGSFDPVTNGHLDIIRRASAIFDRVVVGVLHNPDKKGCFPVHKRLEMLEKACEGLDNVDFIAFDGLLAELTQRLDIPVVIRGVRGMQDLESETAMARINHQLNPRLETLFLPAASGREGISASMVRQLAQFGADLSAYVPKKVLPDIQAAFSNHHKESL